MQKAYIDGKWRPVQEPREIRRGKNKGRIEVKVNKLRKTASGWAPVPRPIILDPEQIHH